MVNATEASSSRIASSSKPVTDSNEASASATTLLRSLKSAQSSHAERISTARQAVLETKIPRAAELVRQWILDEWLVPSKSSAAPSIIQPEYHALFATVNGSYGSPPFAVLVRCISELEKHGAAVSAAPVASLTGMIASHVQTSTYARWVELWTGMVAWLAGAGVMDQPVGDGEVQSVKDLSDAIFQHIMESTDIVQAESSSTAILVKATPQLAIILSHQPLLAEHLITSFAEVLRSLPSDSLDQFLVPTLSSQHAPIAHLLPLLLRSLASTRSRLRYSIFTQPTSSKVAYETHIAQSLHEALYRDFSQAMAYLDGVALLGGVPAGAVWEARFGCWDEIRRLDVRVEGVERWRALVAEASRGARAVLASGDEAAVRVCLKVLGCLSVLDYSAAGISDSVVQLALQSAFINSTEGADLLLAVLHHHRLIRAPVAYIELLCRCISAPNTNDAAPSTSSTISSSLLAAITDLITHSGETLTCWRVLVRTSEEMLSRPSEASLITYANLLAALVVAGCPEEILLQLRETWVVRTEDIPAKAKAKSKGKSKGGAGDSKLSAVLTVQSALKGGVDEEIIRALKGVMEGRTATEVLDIAVCRFLVSVPTETLSDSSVIDQLLIRLSGTSSLAYWALFTPSVMRRLESRATDEQLETLGKAMISHISPSRYLWTSTSFWELPRTSSILLRLILHSEMSDPSIGFAVPYGLQTAELAVKHVEKAGSLTHPVETVRMWLEQANVDALSTFPAGVVLASVIDTNRRSLSRVIVTRLLLNPGSKIPNVLLELVQKIREQAQATKPKLDLCSAMMEINCLFTSRKWASIPAAAQTDLSQISAVCSKVLGKSLAKRSGDDLEAKGRLWLNLHSFAVWAGETNKIASFPDQLVQSLLSSPNVLDPALSLRLIAARKDSTAPLIAVYSYLRSTTHALLIDEAMSIVIKNASLPDYSLLWENARHPSLDGGLLALLISTTREGSGKVVRGHLGPILAAVHGNSGSSEILCSLWRHRAILFDSGQAIDSWVTFSGIFLSSPPSDIACSLLDAATSFSQQRSDLLPDTSSAITTAICSIFTYLRGRVDTALAQKIARFLDSLGRSAGASGGSGAPKRKLDDNSNRRQTLTRAMARHVPVILIAYARGATDPIRNISAVSRRIVDPSLAELCMSTDAATGKAFDSTGIPYGLGEGLAGEAESAVWAQIWRSWKKKRYTGQG